MVFVAFVCVWSVWLLSQCGIKVLFSGFFYALDIYFLSNGTAKLFLILLFAEEVFLVIDLFAEKVWDLEQVLLITLLIWMNKES